MDDQGVGTFLYLAYDSIPSFQNDSLRANVVQKKIRSALKVLNNLSSTGRQGGTVDLCNV